MRIADNQVRTLLGHFSSSLAGQYDPGEVKAILRAVFQHALGWDASQMEFRREEALSESDLIKVYHPLKRVEAGEPLQYVLGEVYFHGLQLLVAPGVLIPRPETEELVQLVLEEGGTPNSILDIGTGSGCIALALKKAFPQAQLFGMDRSAEALAIARRNAQRNDLQVEWSEVDVLEPRIQLPRVELIVSNPPYVPRSEEASLSTQVREFEPHIALFVEDADPLLFYRRIGELAMNALTPGGRLFFEGHYLHADAVADVLKAQGFNAISVIEDMSGNPRFIRAER